VIEADDRTFQREVIEASRDTPVLVDFWAPWCGPCRALGPLLERLEDSYSGRFRLVKVNVDLSPGLSAQYAVQSIPYVVAFVGGRAVDRFVGALPEGQLRVFIDRVVPSPAEAERRRAHRLLESGRVDAAVGALRAAVELDPAHREAHLDLAAVLLERMPPPADAARLDEIERELAAVDATGRLDPRWRALDLCLSSLRSASTQPSRESLEARIAAEPNDLAARLRLAERYTAERRFDAALEQLFEIIGRDRKFQSETVRGMALSLFDLMGDQPERVRAYRLRLASLINR
jgi:putative thioredoxin